MTAAKYTIVGAGAIGGTLAVHLDAAGVPVQLIDADTSHVEAVRRNGLTLTTPTSTLTARVAIFTLDDAPSSLERVILAVKAQATASAVEWIAPRLAPDGFIASLQNGLNEDKIASLVGADRTMSAFVDLFADVIEPGVIKDGGHGGIALGEYAGGDSRRVHELAADLAHWGTPVVSDNVNGFLWSKLAFGAMLTATALADDDMSALIDRHRPVMTELAAEIIEVADAHGIALEAFDAFEPAAFRRGASTETTTAALNGLVAWLATQSKTRSGIWRDIVVRERKTEVPTHYAPIIAAAGAARIPVPALTALVESIGRRERGESEMGDSLIAELDVAGSVA